MGVNNSCTRKTGAAPCAHASKRYTLYPASIPELHSFQHILAHNSKVHVTPLRLRCVLTHITHADGD